MILIHIKGRYIYKQNDLCVCIGMRAGLLKVLFNICQSRGSRGFLL